MIARLLPCLWLMAGLGCESEEDWAVRNPGGGGPGGSTHGDATAVDAGPDADDADVGDGDASVDDGDAMLEEADGPAPP